MAPSTSEEKPAAKKMVGLPVLVTSPIDVGRLIREVETIDETLMQLGLRSPGEEVKLPKTSQLMDKLIEINQINLLHKTDRAALLEFLKRVKDEAPVLHMSFSADPSVSFLEKLTAWLRREIHPLTLVSVGLEPTIGAGCIVRTVNHQFDFSLKQNFAKKKQLLKDALKMPEAASPPADQPAAPTDMSAPVASGVPQGAAA
jgi:hypothetical protein